MTELLPDLRAGFGLMRRLPGFLRQHIDHDSARAIVGERLRRRGELLLGQIRDQILPFADHPSARLLQHAGATLADIAELVREQGVESTLGVLFRLGVYLTEDELKGRVPVVRGSLHFGIEPGQLRNHRVGRHLALASSGSSGRPTSTFIDLDSLLENCPNSRLVSDAWGLTDLPTALWGLPGSAGIMNCLRLIAIGKAPPQAWFTLVDAQARSIDARVRLGPLIAASVCRMMGCKLPIPRYTPMHDPAAVLDWLRVTLASGNAPYLSTSPSAGVRLCEAARAAGLDLSGTRMSVRGEPLTPARRAFLQAAGIMPLVIYGSAELNLVAYGCSSGEHADEMHLMSDLHALIQAEHRDPLPPRAFLLTPLLPHAATVVLNLCIGDAGVVTATRCGCPLEQHGWTTRLHTVLSFAKLSALGMTFADTDVLAVLERVLPNRFGGTPLSYQLLEEDDADDPRLTLVVDPAVGVLDEAAVCSVFLESIAKLGPMQRVMSDVWRQAGVVRVKRQTAIATATGKVLHLRSKTSPE